MSTWPSATSALDATTQTFPILTESQVARARPCGNVRKVELGEILFQPGDINVPFFVLLSGTMEIVQPYCEGERLIATHGPAQFTGEMTMISGREGWMPIELLSLQGALAVVAQDYSAKELAVQPGDEVDVEEVRHGCALVRDTHGGLGWLPRSHIDM